ncbi:DUF1643 domain-containing protein [Sabulicella rubraurantiaca]|uniref:DUF1643 domain-containing protein n=1 Tax=Sabulicella rubraurantiaca TaxID=2811429 RepID=UPI001A979FB0|nr:DUF1643 domain-containing protein [Sabulicella rubraurantiaca]
MSDPHDPGGRVRLRLAEDVVSEAEFSPCRRWRWTLERRWDGRPIGSPGVAAVIGMNPSTADVDVDDPTVQGVMWRARHLWGAGGCVMLNAFAYRVTDKRRLLEVDDPVGAENDAAIARHAARASTLVVAWGQPPKPLAWRGPQLASMLAGLGLRPLCFGVNGDGSPKHPLYQRRDAPLIPYPIRS